MGGYEQLVRGEPMRGRFRKSYENPQPFVPGDVDKVEYTMPDVYHLSARPSHHGAGPELLGSLSGRSASAAFVDSYTAKASDFQKVTERVYRSRSSSSRLIVNVLP